MKNCIRGIKKMYKTETEALQKLCLLGGHVCSTCKEGTHGTCFGTCQCAYCDEYWSKKNV